MRWCQKKEAWEGSAEVSRYCPINVTYAEDAEDDGCGKDCDVG